MTRGNRSGGYGNKRFDAGNKRNEAQDKDGGGNWSGPDSEVLAQFRKIARQLNERHDRHERVVKLSRDVTIESKRIIFLLHSPVNAEQSAQAMAEAEMRLRELASAGGGAAGGGGGPLYRAARELAPAPAYLHARAISPGLQEFVEAYSFYQLLSSNTLPTHQQLQHLLTYSIENEDKIYGNKVIEMNSVLLPRLDFMMGLADVTGELMRCVVNSLGAIAAVINAADPMPCVTAAQQLRDIYVGFLGATGLGREAGCKLWTMRSSVLKAEACLYALRVRSGEAPPHLLLPMSAPVPPQPAQHSVDTDEGFY